MLSSLGLCSAAIVAVIGLAVWQQTPRTPSLPTPPLKELAAHHDIEVGNFAILKRLGEKPYANILSSQFNLALIDNIPNWHFVDHDLRPSATTYDFSQMDKVVDFANKNHMHMQAHHFLWGEEKWLPDWLVKDSFSKDQIYGLMQDHIKTVGQHYAGKIQEWTVVNEAFTRGTHLYGLHDWWADNTSGIDYIDKAFTWARQADPGAELILNDFHNEGKNDISDAMYDYIKGALLRGIPIDGIGMQMHIDGTAPPDKDEVIKNMQRFGDLGVKVYVTEFDVNMNDVKANAENKDTIEGEIYYNMARACIESKVCPSFSVLGITDKETWYNYMGTTPNARPLPFDDKYQPKPAFFKLRDAFNQDN